MSMSLREQLLAAGLVSKKQAKHSEQQQRQQHHQQAKGKAAPDKERERAAQQAQAAKAARDQELNRQRQEAAERKERALQIKQLIAENKLPKLETDDYFNFIDRGKVRRMSVDAARRTQIVAGQLVIVRFEGRYDLVLPAIAERIRERDPRVVVSLDSNPAEAKPEGAAEDPYKDYVVPDDLMW
jgi:uncharacterized protein YaiL (DUF2058 family)